MEKPPAFFCRAIPWGTWISTHIDVGTNDFEAHTASATRGFSNQQIESNHPGFTKAYLLLDSLDIDAFFMTRMLKFCILRADGLPLDQFLEQSDTLSLIKHGMSLGLMGQELAELVASSVRVQHDVELPNDLGSHTC